MPSLRRTLSTPSVRSSPYTLSPSNNANAGHGARSHGHGPRRSSGSETSSRRVLADIEWWRVVEGQCDTDANAESGSREHDQDQDQDQNQDHGVQLTDELTGDAGTSLPDEGAERPSSVLSWTHIPSSTESLSLPIPQFAALSITPRTPTRRYTLESSSSSLESTPEPAELPIDGVPNIFNDLELGFEDGGCPPALPTRHPPRPVILPLNFRSYSFGGFPTVREDEVCIFTDAENLLPSLFK